MGDSAVDASASARRSSKAESRALRRHQPYLTKMIEAATHGRAQELHELLRSSPGGVTATTDADNQTVLHAACFAGQPQCVRVLLNAGAVVEQRMRGGLTPLIAAVQGGDLECVQLLLDARADIYAVALGKTAEDHAKAGAATHISCPHPLHCLLVCLSL